MEPYKQERFTIYIATYNSSCENVTAEVSISVFTDMSELGHVILPSVTLRVN